MENVQIGNSAVATVASIMQVSHPGGSSPEEVRKLASVETKPGTLSQMRATSLISRAFVQSQQFLQSASQPCALGFGNNFSALIHTYSEKEQQSPLLVGKTLTPSQLLPSRTTQKQMSTSGPIHNPWAKLRGDGIARPSTLGQGVYTLIMVFALGSLTSQIYAYPPRVTAMMGLIFAILYTRRP
eukprot:gene23295-30531_t